MLASSPSLPRTRSAEYQAGVGLGKLGLAGAGGLDPEPPDGRAAQWVTRGSGANGLLDPIELADAEKWQRTPFVRGE